MAAAAARKYAGLPDLDEAADIFETPDLAEDASTTAASATLRTESRASSNGGSDDDDDGAVSGIDRHRLNQDEARARFLDSRVDARSADFSDRILANGADKRSYVVSTSKSRSRRRRRRRRAAAAARRMDAGGDEDGDEDGGEDDIGSSTEEEEEDDGPEGLRRRLARLNREAAELRADMQRLQASSGGGSGTLEDGAASARALDASLASLNKTIMAGQAGAQGRLAQRLGTTDDAGSTANAAAAGSDGNTADDAGPTATTAYTIAYAPSYDSGHALARAAAFDGRLAALEAALGVSSVALPMQGQSTGGGGGAAIRPAYPKPVLPTLDILDRQLAVLVAGAVASGSGGSATAVAATAGGAGLEAVGRRVQQLTRDAERLAEARRDAKEAQEALTESWSRNAALGGRGLLDRRGSENVNGGGGGDGPVAYGGGGPGGEGGGGGGLGLDDPETIAKVNALHGLLPTIEALAPVVPGLLDRLRSLRLIHADAAGASKSLAALEKRQADVDEEIREWRDSLRKVEAQLSRDGEGIKENMQTVEEWVKELEERIKKL